MRLRFSDRCAVLLCAFLLIPGVFSQRKDYTFEKWQENKFWFWASDGPITKALDAIPDVVHGVKMILDHFERVEEGIIARTRSREPPRTDDSVRTCRSIDQVDWPRAVRANFGARGFPDPDLSCITDFTGVRFTPEEIPPYTVDQLYEAMLRHGLAIKANVKSVVSRLIDVEKNFTAPDYVFNYPYKTPAATCVLQLVAGIRVGGKWRVSVGLHNRPKEESLPELGRKLFLEHHRVVNGHLTDNSRMRLPVRPENGAERIIREDATTIIINSRGNANPSLYRNIPLEENLAIITSLDMASTFIQQAEDAVAPSNIAILVLPLALNIIPIAFFAEVSNVKMLVYLLLSDILTVIPLLIKGIELIGIESGRHRSIVFRVSSSLNSTRSEAAAGEMWAAECQARESIRDSGITFVYLSAAFLVGGIVLELASRSYIKRHNRRRRKVVYDEAGLMLTDFRGAPGEVSASALNSSHSYSGYFGTRQATNDKSDRTSYDSYRTLEYEKQPS